MESFIWKWLDRKSGCQDTRRGREVPTLRGWRLAHTGDVRLRVFDVLGRQVADLLDEPRAAGAYEVRFDAARLPAGV
jgi:hypothetical protein